MKTILFFDRCDLTRFYILLTKELRGNANIIHVSFSEKETKMLEDAGIRDYVDYQKELSFLIDTLEPTDELIKEVDHFIIQQSKGKFTLNGSIQSDRGYTLLSYKDALLLACCHFSVWKKIFSMQHVDIMYHEPASLLMTHIAGLMCKAQGGFFYYPTQLISDRKGFWYLNLDGENFSCNELENRFAYYQKHPEEIDVNRCKSFLEKFRNDYSVAFSDLIKPLRTTRELRLQAFKGYLLRLLKRNSFDRLKNNVDYWMLNTNKAAEKLYNLKQYRKRKIKFVQPVEGDKYFYYSMHLEPEATVLYLSGGMYTNQVKLIENIAASLPPGFFLYVKDHPHEFAYRKADDYERLLKIPNIRLIDQRISGKSLIKGATGVFSINGTASFEALLLGKQSYCFGETYYTKTSLVSFVKNIKDLRQVIYDNMQRDYKDGVELYTYVYSYLMTLKEGFVTYFGMDRVKNSRIDEKANAKMIVSEIMKKEMSM